MKTKTSLTTKDSPICVEMIACLQECLDDLESGDSSRIARWNPDPYTERVPPLTQDIADKMVAGLDQEFNIEIDQFSAYHERRSGANAHTEWFRLPPSARLGLAQRLARIADAYN